VPKAHRRESGFGSRFNAEAEIVETPLVAERIRTDGQSPKRSEKLHRLCHIRDFRSVHAPHVAFDDVYQRRQEIRSEAAIGNSVIHREREL
jgi:hypothetical protein